MSGGSVRSSLVAGSAHPGPYPRRAPEERGQLLLSDAAGVLTHSWQFDGELTEWWARCLRRGRAPLPARARRAAPSGWPGRMRPRRPSLTRRSGPSLPGRCRWDLGETEEHGESPLPGGPNHLIRSVRGPAHPEHAIAALQQPLRDRMKDLLED